MCLWINDKLARHNEINNGLTRHNEINGKVVEDSWLRINSASASVLAQLLHRHGGNDQRGRVMVGIVATSGKLKNE